MGMHIVANSHIFVLRFGQLRVLQHVKRYRFIRIKPSTILVILSCGRLVYLALSHCSFTFNSHVWVLRLNLLHGLTILIISNYRMSLQDILPGLVQILYIAFIHLLFNVFQILLLSGRYIISQGRFIWTSGVIISLSVAIILLNLNFSADTIFTRATQTGRIHGAPFGIFMLLLLFIWCSAICRFNWRFLSLSYLSDLSTHKQRLMLLKLLLF